VLAPPAQGLWPGKDPVYAAPGEPLDLRWTSDAPGFQLELLPIGSDVVLLQRDVAVSPARIEVPWEGAFRWRVSARDQRGLEGVPSETASSSSTRDDAGFVVQRPSGTGHDRTPVILHRGD
jgi:hypothetical protein